MKIARRTRWRMQVLLFLMTMLLALTGLLNWLLPHGGTVRTLRHMLRWIHEGAAIGFFSLVAAHLILQAEAIRRNMRRYGLWGRD